MIADITPRATLAIVGHTAKNTWPSIINFFIKKTSTCNRTGVANPQMCRYKTFVPGRRQNAPVFQRLSIEQKDLRVSAQVVVGTYTVEQYAPTEHGVDTCSATEQQATPCFDRPAFQPGRLRFPNWVKRHIHGRLDESPWHSNSGMFVGQMKPWSRLVFR
jgi:hypothetical protein